MKYIITESQMDRAVLKYLNSEYGDLEPYEMDKIPGHIFFKKDGEFIFMYDKKDGYVFISDENLWPFLESFFGLEYEEIQSLSKKWIEDNYNLNVTRILRSTS